MELSDDIVTTTRTPSQMERSLLAIPKGATRIAWIGPLFGACDGRAFPLLQSSAANRIHATTKVCAIVFVCARRKPQGL